MNKHVCTLYVQLLFAIGLGYPSFLKSCPAMSSNLRVVLHQQAALQFSAVTMDGQPTDRERSKIAKVEKKLALDLPEANAAAGVKGDEPKSEEEAAPQKRPAAQKHPAAKCEPSSMKVASKKTKQAVKKKPATKKQ